MSWRNELYQNVQSEKFSSSLKTANDVLSFVESEFNKLIEPIKEDCTMEKIEGRYYFTVLNKDLEVDVTKGTITFKKIVTTPKDGVILITMFQQVDGVYHEIIDNHPVRINESTVDKIFKKAFYLN